MRIADGMNGCDEWMGIVDAVGVDGSRLAKYLV